LHPFDTVAECNGRTEGRTERRTSLNLKNQKSDGQNVRSMLKKLYAGCLDLSLVISAQFTLELCATTKHFSKTAKIAQNTKTFYLLRSRLFKVIDNFK